MDAQRAAAMTMFIGSIACAVLLVISLAVIFRRRRADRPEQAAERVPVGPAFQAGQRYQASELGYPVCVRGGGCSFNSGVCGKECFWLSRDDAREFTGEW